MTFSTADSSSSPQAPPTPLQAAIRHRYTMAETPGKKDFASSTSRSTTMSSSNLTSIRRLQQHQARQQQQAVPPITPISSSSGASSIASVSSVESLGDANNRRVTFSSLLELQQQQQQQQSKSTTTTSTNSSTASGATPTSILRSPPMSYVSKTLRQQSGTFTPNSASSQTAHTIATTGTSSFSMSSTTPSPTSFAVPSPYGSIITPAAVPSTTAMVVSPDFTTEATATTNSIIQEEEEDNHHHHIVPWPEEDTHSYNMYEPNNTSAEAILGLEETDMVRIDNMHQHQQPNSSFLSPKPTSASAITASITPSTANSTAVVTPSTTPTSLSQDQAAATSTLNNHGATSPNSSLNYSASLNYSSSTLNQHSAGAAPNEASLLNYSTSTQQQSLVAVTTEAEEEFNIDIPNIDNTNAPSNNSNNHLSLIAKEDDNWRRHGQAYRTRLVEHDEQTGRHAFEMSDDCSLKRYHLVAEKVLNQFLETREDPHVNLRDTYLVGTRLSKFLSVVLPTHKDYHSTDPELSELRRLSHQRSLTLQHYLEELALIIDEEEHNQFVLRDLNDTLDNHTTAEDSSAATSPPPSVIAAAKQSSSPTTITTTASSSTALVPATSTDITTSASQELQEQHQQADDGDDSWKAVDTHTVASLDTNWFSTGGFSTGAFSDPFPPSDMAVSPTMMLSSSNDNQTKDRYLLRDQEQIMQITGSNHRHSRLDHENVDFTNMSLEDDTQTLDSFAKGLHQKSSASTASPPSSIATTESRWRIAPFSSSTKKSTDDSFKEGWGTSPFLKTPGKSSERRVSWMQPPQREEERASPNVTDAMSWWDNAVDESKCEILPPVLSTASSTDAQIDAPEIHTSSTASEEPQHTKVKARRSSRYMVLEEHEAHQRKNNRRKQVAPNGAILLNNDDEQQLLSKEPSDVSRDVDLSHASTILDSNKAKGKDAQSYRHRGMYHFRECVRCLLE